MIAEIDYVTEREEVLLPEGLRRSDFKKLTNFSKDTLKEAYKASLQLKLLFPRLGQRDPNLTGGLSETIIALHHDWWIQSGNIPNASGSFDLFDHKRGKRIQAKASGTETYAPHSFKAKNGESWELDDEWDELHFMDMSRCDWTADLYLIPDECIDNAQTSSVADTFEERRLSGLETKISLMNKVIKPNNLKPYGVIDIKNL